jgi:hypothetical protein
LKGSKSLASKQKKAAEAAKAEAAGAIQTKAADMAVMKAAEAAKAKATESAKAKAARSAEAVMTKKDADGKGKALVISKAPRREAKEGHEAALIQSPAVDEVVNEPVSQPASTGDFSELHKQLALAHEVSLPQPATCTICIAASPRGSNWVSRAESSLFYHFMSSRWISLLLLTKLLPFL